MDYPHPYIALDPNGVPDLSPRLRRQHRRVGQGIHRLRLPRIRSSPPNRTEDPAALNDILEASQKRGLLFITDDDARPFGGAHPNAHLWDNGPSPSDELNRIFEIRKAALARFGENAIKPGTPMAQLEDTLVPLYLLHRYQTEATIKEIGGLDYRYALRGDGQLVTKIVAPAEQKKALTAVLITLSPDFLTLPESLLAILPPRPMGLARTRESFPSQTALTFDPIATAESAADLTLAVLLDPARASRLVQYHMREGGSLSLRGVLEAISTTTAERTDGGHTMSSEVGRAVETRALEAMFALATNPQPPARPAPSPAPTSTTSTNRWTTAAPLTDTAEAIHRAAIIDRIKEFHRDPAKFIPAKPIEAPPGMPIGDDEEM